MNKKYGIMEVKRMNEMNILKREKNFQIFKELVEDGDLCVCDESDDECLMFHNSGCDICITVEDGKLEITLYR